MQSIKKKFWFIQEPLDEKTFTWIRKNFQQRECSNGKFQRKSWGLVYQFAPAFLHKRKEWDFSHKGWVGGGGEQGHPWIPQILTPPYQRVLGFQIVGKAQRDMSRKKTSEAFIISFTVFFFILLLYGCMTALLYQVSVSLTTFKLVVSLRPV